LRTDPTTEATRPPARAGPIERHPSRLYGGVGDGDGDGGIDAAPDPL